MQKSKKAAITNRKDQVEKCKRCDNDDDDLENWMPCPGTTATRMKIVRYMDVSLSILTDRPSECHNGVEYA